MMARWRARAGVQVAFLLVLQKLAVVRSQCPNYFSNCDSREYAYGESCLCCAGQQRYWLNDRYWSDEIGWEGWQGWSCQECPPGYYNEQPSSGSCYYLPICGPGQFLSGSSCVPCAAGKFKSTTGHEGCSACQSNSNSPAGSTSSTSCVCNAGYVGPAGGTCAACVPGKYSNAGAHVCTDCPAGKISWGSGKTACEVCGPGTFSATAGNDACTECGRGKYRPLLNGVPTVQVTCGGNDDFKCRGCTPSSGKSSGIISSGSGHYRDRSNCWWLLSISPGAELQFSFTDFLTEENKDFVTIYECGSALCSSQSVLLKLSGVLEPTNVYRSTASFLKVTLTSDESTYFTQQYVNDLGNFQMQWSAAYTATTCSTCAAGSFSPASGLSVCTDCVAGKISGEWGAAACSDCEAGKFNTVLHQSPTADVTCGGTNCDEGYYCDSSSGKSTGIIGNQWQTYKPNANCWWLLKASPGAEIRLSFPYLNLGAPDHQYAGRTGDFLRLYQCDDAECNQKTEILSFTGKQTDPTIIYSSATGVLQMTFTSDGYSYDEDFAVPGTWIAVDTSTTCMSCMAGTYSEARDRVCTNCAAGKYSAQIASIACADCLAGKYLETTGAFSENSCDACADGKFSGAGAQVCTNCAAGKYSKASSFFLMIGDPGPTVCTDCVPGKFSAAGASDCTKCAAGKYSASGGFAACTNCPDNSTSVEDSSNPSACVCIVGYAPVLGTDPSAMPLKCSACPPGSFKSTQSVAPAEASSAYIENEKCRDCAVGEYAAHRDEPPA